MRRLFPTILSGVIGLWLANYFIAEVEFTGTWKTLLIVGVVLGLINFFIKPILKIITLPIRLLTLGLFGILINIGIIWAIDIAFTELVIEGIIPLVWTTLIIWGLGILIPLLFPKRKPKII